LDDPIFEQPPRDGAVSETGMTTDMATLQASSGGAVPAIDRSVLGEWLGDDDAGINALLLIFRDSVCAEQDHLKEALTRDDLTDYAKTAHRLKGAALAMGARGLADIAGALNDAAKGGDATSCAIGMTALDIQVRLMAAEVPDEPPAAGPVS
jgi:HPt (histidine-containing phosphotransfer) domain-containing protein